MLTVWTGLSIGAIYVLVAIGFNIVFLASGTFNFAQPQYLMLGTFVAYAVAVSHGMSPWVAIAVGAAVGCAVGALEERLAVRPLAGSGVHGELVTTVGWATMMQGAVLLIWGSQPRAVPGVASGRVISLLGGRLTITDLVLIVIAVMFAVGLHVLTRSTIVGLASLATSEDREAAMLRGVNVRRLSIGAFCVAGALMGALGPVVGPKTYAIFSIGSVIVLKAFFAMSIGGFGSNIGALIGGMGVGMVETFTNRYLGSNYVDVIIFALFLTLLMVRPTGLFGERAERVV